ncbi:hypothetical protein PGIGA_G00117220, partial [Pangasianodon gigas]|nr:hypothetical protein [Pangasianodon gigas]
MFSVRMDNSERNSSLAAFFPARSPLFILFFFFFSSVNSGYTIISTVLYMPQNINTCSGVKKRRGRGVCFFVTNQCANKIVVKK